MSKKLAIGLMSGTSIDALDAALISSDGKQLHILASQSRKWSPQVKQGLHELCQSSADEVEHLGDLGIIYAQEAAALIGELLAEQQLKPQDITVVGSHGQTIRHRPKRHFSYQLDNGPCIAALTGIDTVVDFRSADLAYGGEGAPLTPLFHQAVFSKTGTRRLVLNLGGIANLTVLDEAGAIIAGFDCGPANTLCDLCCRRLLQQEYDQDARHARQGQVVSEWLNQLLLHPFLKLRPPKSTGREDFNEDLIKPWLSECTRKPELTDSLLRTLTEYTVVSSVNAIREYLPDLRPAELILCGGGALNPLMRELFAQKLSPFCQVFTAEDFGLSSQFLEPQAFAYFALCCVEGKALDLTNVTGASHSCILGCLCPARDGHFAARARRLR